jgi:hypothetical protein
MGGCLTTNRFWIHRIILMIIMGAFLAGCSQFNVSFDQMDISPFTGIPCAAPCWQGLVIGKSTESEVMSTLQTLTFINQKTVYIHRMSMPGLDQKNFGPGAEVTANCIHPSEQCLTISVEDGILTGVEVALNYKIRLDEAIEYLGDPDYINYQMLGAENVSCEIQLVWKNRQFVLASVPFTGDMTEKYCDDVKNNGKTVSSLIISKARYVSMGEIDLLLSPDNSDLFRYTGTIPGK